MQDKFFLLHWSILAIIGGGILLFGSPSLMRGYSDAENNPEQLKRLINWNRTGGTLFFILGHLMLIFQLRFVFVEHEYIQLYLALLIVPAEVFILYKFKIIKSLSEKRTIKKVLLYLSIWLLANVLLFFILFKIDSAVWSLAVLVQIVLILIIVLIRIYNKLE